MRHTTPILVTGSAGFIGLHLCQHLLECGFEVVGFDNLNPYYDPALKRARLGQLQNYRHFRFIEGDLADQKTFHDLFASHQIRSVIHLAAQAGVRYSLQDPHAYAQSNLLGFLTILEACRRHGAEHLIYASTSSVYGSNSTMPFCETDNTDHPLSFYAATKKANEAMAHSYAHLYGLPTTGLRFFTVYGPWGRPDMALWLFTEAIIKGEPITLFNHGRMQRDFTYVTDIVEAIAGLMDKVPTRNHSYDTAHPDSSTSQAPYRIYNIGNHKPVNLGDMVALLEKALNKKAKLIYADMQNGDVESTFANIDRLAKTVGFKPRTSLEEGIRHFVDWYQSYQNNSLR